MIFASDEVVRWKDGYYRVRFAVRNMSQGQENASRRIQIRRLKYEIFFRQISQLRDCLTAMTRIQRDQDALS